MPKPRQDDHLGHKLREAISLKTPPVTQAAVAKHFGVKAPSVNGDWLKHGRIHKRHYPELVRYFGLPYEWWFGSATGDPRVEAIISMLGTMNDRGRQEALAAVSAIAKRRGLEQDKPEKRGRQWAEPSLARS